MEDTSLTNKFVLNSIFSEAPTPRRRDTQDGPRPRRNVEMNHQGQCKIPLCRESATTSDGFCAACGALDLQGDYELYLAFIDEGMSRHQAMQMSGLDDYP